MIGLLRIPKKTKDEVAKAPVEKMSKKGQKALKEKGVLRAFKSVVQGTTNKYPRNPLKIEI